MSNGRWTEPLGRYSDTINMIDRNEREILAISVGGGCAPVLAQRVHVCYNRRGRAGRCSEAVRRRFVSEGIPYLLSALAS